MRIAGSEDAVGHREGRGKIERREQVCRRLLEPATEEVGFANSVQIDWHTVARAEAEVSLKVFEREIGLPGKNPEQSTPVPPPRQARVEGETPVDQSERDIDVLAKISEDEGRAPE